MTKRYAILQKKLREFERDLDQVLGLPAAETPCHHLLSDGIDQRLVFLNNLLSAEIASHPSRPHHLHHIASRLAYLETAFRDWAHDGDHGTSVLPHRFDAASCCSCTESCLINDDGEGSVDGGFSTPFPEEPEIFYEPVVEEKEPVEEEESVIRVLETTDHHERDREEAEVEGIIGVWVWRYCGVMAGGFVIGALLMSFFMVRFSGFSGYTEHGGGCQSVPT